MKRGQNRTGFTIVELLIVIVVIAILAAITIVAYNGVQNRANDSVVESDIANFVKIIRFAEAETGQIPTPGSKTASPDSTLFPGIKFRPSKASYSTTIDNFFYCSGTVSGVTTFNIGARSKSGTTYLYKSNSGLSKPSSGDPYGVCTTGFDGTTVGYSYGYFTATNTWYSWTN